MTNPEKVFKKINSLLCNNAEVEQIYLNLVDNVNSTLLKNFLRVSAYERNQFIKALDADLRANNLTPIYLEESLRTTRALSIELKNLIAEERFATAFNKIGSIQIKDIERYKKVINKLELPDSTEALLKKQLDILVTSLYSVEIHKDLLSRARKSA